MHATIDVRLTVRIDDDRTIPLAMLAEFITGQNIESVLLEGLVESLDAARVEALCGEKHTHGNGENRYFPNESRECCLNATKQSLSV